VDKVSPTTTTATLTLISIVLVALITIRTIVLITTLAPMLTPILDIVQALVLRIGTTTSLAIVSVVLPTTFAIITDTLYIVGVLIVAILLTIITP
jgi:hypothetical protein